MARPKTKLTIDNFYEAYDYFKRFLEKENYATRVLDRIEMKSAFENIIMPDYKSDDEMKTKKSLESFQAWIDRYAQPKWQNFLALNRQQRFKKRHFLISLDMSVNAHCALRRYAQAVNLTLSEAIEILADNAYKSLPGN